MVEPRWTFATFAMQRLGSIEREASFPPSPQPSDRASPSYHDSERYPRVEDQPDQADDGPKDPPCEPSEVFRFSNPFGDAGGSPRIPFHKRATGRSCLEISVAEGPQQNNLRLQRGTVCGRCNEAAPSATSTSRLGGRVIMCSGGHFVRAITFKASLVEGADLDRVGSASLQSFQAKSNDVSSRWLRAGGGNILERRSFAGWAGFPKVDTVCRQIIQGGPIHVRGGRIPGEIQVPGLNWRSQQDGEGKDNNQPQSEILNRQSRHRRDKNAKTHHTLGGTERNF